MQVCSGVAEPVAHLCLQAHRKKQWHKHMHIDVQTHLVHLSASKYGSRTVALWMICVGACVIIAPCHKAGLAHLCCLQSGILLRPT